MKGVIKMLVKIKSYKPYSICYTWYGNLIGKTVNVKPKKEHQRDYIIDDPNIETLGTIYDCAIHEDDIEIIER